MCYCEDHLTVMCRMDWRKVKEMCCCSAVRGLPQLLCKGCGGLDKCNDDDDDDKCKFLKNT